MTKKTTNFVRLYTYAQGKSEVPPAFHMWSCISLIAACVANKVYVKWIEDQPIYPHVFTFLIAPSGIGKNIAITAVEQLIVGDMGLRKWVNHYRGKITGPALYDLLGKEVFDENVGESGKYVPPPSNVWFVTPELKNSMGSPEMAQSLIETMTELWSACGTTFTDRTRTNDQIIIDDPCINWLAGTTKEWLMKAVKPDDIRGGFFARVLPVYFPYLYPKEKVCRPKYPKDRGWIWQGLQDRVYKLCQLSGEVVISSEADAYIDQWYENRQYPSEDALAPYHNRAREMILKLAVLFTLADNEKMKIELGHFQLAMKHYQLLQNGVLELIEYASQSPQTTDVRIVRKVLSKFGELTRTDLLKKVYSHGIDQYRLNAAVSQLLNMEWIRRDTGEKGAIIYRYREGR